MSSPLLSGLHHQCTACGGSCHGVNVRLVNRDTVGRIEQIGQQMGIHQPLVGDRLRQTKEGRCVFLNPQNGCRIHAAHGPEAKPLICRQYPVVRVRTEGDERVGIDPGCYSAYATQRSVPIRSMEEQAWAQVSFEPPVVRMEGALMALLSKPNQTIEGALSGLSGRAEDVLPPGFSGRLVELLARPEWRAACEHPSAGPSVRLGIRPVLEAVTSWVETGPPQIQVSSEMQAWGLEVARRMVWLRLCPRLPSPMVGALLSLCGALVSAWVSGNDLNRNANTLAAWSRGMRSPMFWAPLFPTPESVPWLLEGRTPTRPAVD